MIMASVGGPLARGGSFRLTSHKFRCLRIFLIISESSINEIIFIDPKHLEHTYGLISYMLTGGHGHDIIHILKKKEERCLF